MANSETRAYSGFLSQLVVVCSLAVFVVLSLVAMFTTGAVPKEMDWIGITVTELGAEQAAAQGIPPEVGGVVAEEVDGMAARAGVRPGDIFLAINGSRIRDMADFAHTTGKTDVSKGGVQLDVIRRGARRTIFVFPSGRPGRPGGQTRAAPGGVVQVPAAINRRWLGIEAETLAPGDAKELGIPAGVTGALIEGVVRGSQAEEAGLSVKDVIVAVNGQPIDSTRSLWNTLGDMQGGDQVEFGVYRDGQLISVAMPPVAGTLAGGLPGQMGGQILAPGGVLACPQCGTTVSPPRGVQCYTVPCPSCGTWMIRAQ